MSKTNPAVIINNYLSAALQQVLPEYYNSVPMAFTPTEPTDIATFYDTLGNFPSNPKALAVYERMFKMRKRAFPHIKCEQLLYYIYVAEGVGGSEEQIASLFETTQAIYDLLDRGDESAQEVNEWQNSNLNINGNVEVGGLEFTPVFFHELQVFQLEETRDLIDFATAKTYTGNKIIVDYEFHAKDFNNAVPFVVQ